MHFHYYTLYQLAQVIPFEPVVSCFSQSRNELVIQFHTFHLRIGCNTPLTYVVPVQHFARARKNVVDLFESIIGKEIVDVYALPYERVLVILLEGEYELYIKLHGPQANVILKSNHRTLELFNNKLTEDWQYVPTPGPFRQSEMEVSVVKDHEQVYQQLRQISPIFEKQFAAKVLQLMKEGSTFHSATSDVIQEAQSTTFYIQKEPQKMKFYLFKPSASHPCIEVTGIIQSLQLFLRTYFQYNRYVKQYKVLNKEIGIPYKKTQKLYQSFQRNIHQLTVERSPEELGHILMANLHHIQPGQKKVVLEDYYQGGTVTIKLKPELSPQENAQKYYEKHKQRKVRLAYLMNELEDIEQRLVNREIEVEAFEQIPSPTELTLTHQGFKQKEIQALKQWMKDQSPNKDHPKHPFREFEKDGFQIFVGKNAKNNDELSFKFASKEDIWLHAKDVSGSHVVIRHKSGKHIPETVLEYAAALAAYYSKRKNDTLVPVIFTPRKYIRKRKGDPPGAVVVEREEVVMIEPIRT